jgi:hypothetical protein
MKRAGISIALSFIFSFALLVTAIHATPQAKVDLSGTWILTVAPPPPAPGTQPALAAEGGRAANAGRGGGPPTLTLKQEGDAITGTLSGGRGAGTPVTGTVSGNAVSLTIARRLADGIPRPDTYKGTISGDTITGSVQEATVDPTQGFSVDFTAKRQASQ